MEIKEFREYLEIKELATATQKEYISNIKLFFNWIGKEDVQVSKPDVLKYLGHLKNKGLQNVTRRNHLIALNHYFNFLYQNEQIAVNPCLFLKIRGTNKNKLYKIYTHEELELLFDNYYQLFVRSYDNSRHRYEQQKQYTALSIERNALMLSILINQGVTTTEIEKIEINDLDLIRAKLKNCGGKRLNSRDLPLKATQIGLFMYYLQNTRPQLMEYHTAETNKLFLSLPAIGKKKTDNETIKNVFYMLAKQIKTFDRQFYNFQHVRASVISFWIKTYGLRKAQHLAGHRNINTTEKYLPNNLDDLIEDI